MPSTHSCDDPRLAPAINVAPPLLAADKWRSETANFDEFVIVSSNLGHKLGDDSMRFQQLPSAMDHRIEVN